MSKETMKLALEVLESVQQCMKTSEWYDSAIIALREALADHSMGCQCPACEKTLHASDCAVHNAPAYPVGECDCGAQPYPENFIDALKYDVARRDSEFFTHCVDQPYDWSEWVCPDPKGYLMKCCDCGLVHEAEFGVVRYKSETEREDCELVEDPNLQAVFRMRRSEQPAQRKPLTITEESAWDLARYVYARSNPHESPQILLSAMEIKQIIETAHGIGEKK